MLIASAPLLAPSAHASGSVTGASQYVSGDVSAAINSIERSLSWIRSVPLNDRGSSSTRDARIAAYEANMDAQSKLERHFGRVSRDVESTMRRADALLEDANWQLAKRPSPDGRFNGVDVRGALRDSEYAIEVLRPLADRYYVAAPSTLAAPAFTSGAQPGDIDYCETPGMGYRR